MSSTNPTYKDGSLIITPELCTDRNIASEYTSLLTSIAPEGFTFKDYYMGNVEHLPIQFIIDLYYCLPLTDKDKLLWEKCCQIENSTRYYRCHNIDTCDIIADSHHCSKSKKVENSEDVEDSQVVRYGNEVINCQIIYKGKRITNSTLIANSADIFDSYSVINSGDVQNSHGIFESTGIKTSMWLRNCSNSEECYLSSNLHHAANKILCDNVYDNSEPMICNTIVSWRKFERVKAELQALLRRTELFFVADGASVSQAMDMFVQSKPALFLFVNSLTNAAFWREVRDIVPEYNETMAYRISFAEDAFKPFH